MKSQSRPDPAALRAATLTSIWPPYAYANGAVEAPLEEIKRLVGERRWTFRNAERMNLLLGLAGIHYNRDAIEDDFAVALRRHLAAGHRPSPTVAANPRLPNQRVSSSSLRACLPGQPVRHQQVSGRATTCARSRASVG